MCPVYVGLLQLLHHRLIAIIFHNRNHFVIIRFYVEKCPYVFEHFEHAHNAHNFKCYKPNRNVTVNDKKTQLNCESQLFD